jgi:SH3-like domain-containing protein
MVARILTVLALFGLGLAAAADAQPRRQPPYFASISASRAMMRTGPGRTYPGIWLYVRPDLPVRVVEVYQNWRKVEDPDGTQGWMLVNLLSDTRTAIVRGGAPVPMRASPDDDAAIRYRAAPGVVGRISRCGRGWCRFDVHGKAGYIRTSALWGVGADEEVD